MYRSWEYITVIVHRNMNVEIGTEGAQILSWEYINRIFLALGCHTLLCLLEKYISDDGNDFLLHIFDEMSCAKFCCCCVSLSKKTP